MGRWGSEEKKSKGLIGCTMALLLLAATSWAFYTNYNRLENRRTIEKALHRIVNTGFSKSSEQLTSELLEYADEHDITLTEDDISMSKNPDGHGNFIVKTIIQFPMEIDLYFTQFSIQVPIVEEVNLIQF